MTIETFPFDGEEQIPRPDMSRISADNFNFTREERSMSSRALSNSPTPDGLLLRGPLDLADATIDCWACQKRTTVFAIIAADVEEFAVLNFYFNNYGHMVCLSLETSPAVYLPQL